MKTLRILFFIALTLLFNGISVRAQINADTTFPTSIFSGLQGQNHVQGIAYDSENECLYMSFTTSLIKVDMQGRLLGSVVGLTGHLGCIGLNHADGTLYGTLEYKHDAIGKGIGDGTNDTATGFYVALFDTKYITRVGMEASEVMRTVYLPAVSADYEARVMNQGREHEHRFGCSGVDGLCLAPKVGKGGGKMMLYVAYGIYSEEDRTDNDYQVIHCYDISHWQRFAQPLTPSHLHFEGPARPSKVYYVRTGNTNFGVQNLCYDASSHRMWMSVYPGQKKGWNHYGTYAVSLLQKAGKKTLRGIEPATKGRVLQLVHEGEYDAPNDVWGWSFSKGSTGITSLGAGLYYISHNERREGRECTTLYLYRYSPTEGFVRVP